MCYSAVPLFTRKGAPIAYYQPSLFDDDPIPSPRRYSSVQDKDLQNLVVLDVHEGHYDPDLTREFDARMSRAFLNLFENLGPDSDGVRIVLHPGLKEKLEESAGHLRK